MRGFIRIIFFFAVIYFLLTAIRGLAQAFWPQVAEKRKKLTRIDDPLETRHSRTGKPTDLS